jgi:hypothetical protein
MDLPEGLGIVTLGALYYALQILPLHLRGFDLVELPPFRTVLLGVHKAVRSRPNKVTQILGTKGTKAGRLAVVLAGFELPLLSMRHQQRWGSLRGG